MHQNILDFTWNQTDLTKKWIETQLIYSEIDQKRLKTVLDHTIWKSESESDQNLHSNSEGLESESSTIQFGSPNPLSLLHTSVLQGYLKQMRLQNDVYIFEVMLQNCS